MTKQLQILLMCTMLVIIFICGFQIIKLGSLADNQKIQINELQKEIYNTEQLQKTEIKILTEEAIRLGWIARGHKGVTLKEVINRINEK
jgi:hypothetical protein